MRVAKKLISVVLAGTAVAASGAAVDQEGFFVGAYGAKTSSSFDRSGRAASQLPEVRFNRILDDTSAWGVRGGVDQGNARYYATYNYASDSYKGLARLREQTLSGSYDLMFALTDTTRVFGGATAGVTYLKENTRRFSNDSDWGVHAGLQVGVLQALNDSIELEGGYRHTLHDRVSVEFVDRETATRMGRIDLDYSEQWYIGVNWRF